MMIYFAFLALIVVIICGVVVVDCLFKSESSLECLARELAEFKKLKFL